MTYQLHRITVLVVEDNQPMLDIAKSLLLAFGVGHVIGAADGKAGFRQFCTHNPDIVVADWMMKPMDGITFTRLIRNDPSSPNPYVPVILMTGFSERRRVLQARDAGVTEFLVKPFNARDLYKRIAQVIERPRQFVRSEDFFGPDRRRLRAQEFAGPFRRNGDVIARAETLPHLQRRQNDAHETLRRIREERGLASGDKFDLNNPNDIDMI
jgi:CheY-like chemotaxis protein